MRSILPFLTFLMLALTGFSGMAHAADLAGGSLAGVEFVVHAEGDSDEVPSDTDKAYPHHHNFCHGHEIGEPAKSRIGLSIAQSGPRPIAAPAVLLDGRDGRVHLRPPQA